MAGNPFAPMGSSSGSAGGTPPPPPDVADEFAIRTMASDIEMLAKSGGLLTGSQAGIAVSLPTDEVSPSSGSQVKLFIWIMSGIAGAAILFFIGYTLLPRLFPPSPSTPPPASQSQTPVVQQPALPGAETQEVFGHASAFRTEADETLGIDFYTIPVPFTRATYLDQSTARLAAARPSSSFFELSILGPANRPLSWAQLLNLLGAAGIGTAPFEKSFEPDFTAFIYRDGKGAWPGYVLKLKKGMSPLVVQKDLVPMEAATSSIAQLFLLAPGASATFRDAQVSAQPVRSLSWVPSGATFSYGWFFGQYLVLSTSDAGLRAAVDRL